MQGECAYLKSDPTEAVQLVIAPQELLVLVVALEGHLRRQVVRFKRFEKENSA